MKLVWPRGAMDNASDYGSEDSRFESWRGRCFFVKMLVYDIFMPYFVYSYGKITVRNSTILN